ncbi:hypothetical protein GCM10027167_65980 [Nocardia heshunensis]
MGGANPVGVSASDSSWTRASRPVKSAIPLGSWAGRGEPWAPATDSGNGGCADDEGIGCGCGCGIGGEGVDEKGVGGKGVGAGGAGCESEGAGGRSSARMR